MNTPDQGLNESNLSAEPYHGQRYYCPSCRKGPLLPLVSAAEPEYNDNYHCSTCGYSTVIPSFQIIFSQLFSGILGGLLTGYLFIKQLDLILKAYQLNKNVDLTNNFIQSFFALLFIGAFGFLIYKSLRGMRKRQLILRKPNHLSS